MLALFAVLAVIPAGASASPGATPRAEAGAGPAAITLPPGGIGQVSAENLDELLGEGELRPGSMLSELEAPLLAKQLSRLHGITELATVEGLGGSADVEGAILRAIEQLAEEGQEIEELVGSFALALDLEEQLERLYEESPAAHEAGAPEDLEEAVEQALHRTPEEAIDEGLESLTLGELFSHLLGEAAHPEVVAATLLEAADEEGLHELLGSTPRYEPFVTATAAEAAAAIGITRVELAEKLGKTPAQLPEGAPALFTPLRDGRQLGFFAAKKGVAFGLVGEAPPPEEEPEEGEEEGEEEPPTGSGDTSPRKSGDTSAGNATVSASASAVSAPLPGTPGPQPAAAPASSVARIRIVGHSVRGASVTLLVQVAAPGHLTIAGHGVKPARRTLAHAGRFSVTLGATRAAAASLRSHRRVRLSLHASFAPTVGEASVATTTFTLH
ncbi:MAG: hypothetical protein ACYDHT_08480 [Solirubrobacteraceae bacterium]